MKYRIVARRATRTRDHLARQILDRMQERRMSKVLNIFGLIFNLAGVVLLFLFGMPFRIASGG
jgi:hypothetical protein